MTRTPAEQLGIPPAQDGRALFAPKILGWLLDDLEPLVATYLAGGGTVPITLLVAPPYVPLFGPAAAVLGIHTRGDPRCPRGEMYLVDRFQPRLPERGLAW